MADTKISSLTELSTTPDTSDVLPIVDVSDTSQATSGTTKKITRATLLGTVSESEGGTGESSYSQGEVLIGNSSGGLTKTTLTAGSNVTITEGDGSVTIASTDTTGMANVVEDTTPQLGGNLDVNGNSIVSASAGNIAITPDSTGKVVLDGLNWPTADGNNGQVLQTDGSGNLTFTDQTGGGGGTASNSFATINLSANGGTASGDNSVAADSSTDTLSLKAGSGVTLTGDSAGDAITIASSSANSFANVAVSGQTAVDADSSGDTLTLAAGSNVSITTTPATNTVTIQATDTDTTYSGGNAISLSGTTFNHDDTSTQASVDNANGTVVQDVTLDDYGHVTALGSVDLDSRYSQTSHSHAAYLEIADNLSDLNDAATARTNLGLGDAATGTIGTDVQAYDADTAKLDVDQAWTGSQRSAFVTDNDGSFDMNAGQNFKCTPTALVNFTFTNITDGQSGYILLVNGSAYAHTKSTTLKASSTLLTDIGAAGTFLVSYIADGTNVYLTNSQALS